MSANHLINTQHPPARRTFLLLMAGTTLVAMFAACRPITRSAEPPAADNFILGGKIMHARVVTSQLQPGKKEGWRTVNAHTTVIYSKLNVTSRAMATRVAAEQNLV
ncbi:MAG: hypothetical protein DCC55_01990 [Chloroflexi bacterium]|nr:MAG: hypothetical protein DCC55_01990 [Chloroflexota bacterium]